MLLWQTGSGKTYTMSGHEEILDRENYQVRVRCDPCPLDDVRSTCGADTAAPRQGDENTDGVITRSLVYLFEALHCKPDIQYTLKASYLEVYNEQVCRPPRSDPSSWSPLCPMRTTSSSTGR